jgi:hypothetical protein
LLSCFPLPTLHSSKANTLLWFANCAFALQLSFLSS